MNDNKNSTFTGINEAPDNRLTTLYTLFIQKRKLIRIVLFTIVTIFITLIIIIPTTIIVTKKVNPIINNPTTTITTSTIIITTKTNNKCIFTGQIKFFMNIHNFDSLTTADVNDDNKLDIIIADYISEVVRIFLNTGTGTFINQTDYHTGYMSRPSSITIADLNGDNKPDIIITMETKSVIGVFLNKGNGSFNDHVTYSTGIYSEPSSVTTADVNGDQSVDIIVANNNNNNVGIFLNTGIGTFGAQVTYSTRFNSKPYLVTTADVNDDSESDIIVTDSNNSTIGVFLNLGNGTFIDQMTYPTGVHSGTRSIITADVNDDKKLDIIVANQNGDNVGVFLNLGNGSFNDQMIYPTGIHSKPISVTTADVNGDNQFDIIVANSGTKNVGVFFNIGNGTFNDQVIYPSGIRFGGPICFTKRDVDNDQLLDSLFAISDEVSVHLSLRQMN